MRNIPSPGFTGIEEVINKEIDDDRVVLEAVVWGVTESRAERKAIRAVNGNLGILAMFVEPTFDASSIERLSSPEKYAIKAWLVTLEASRGGVMQSSGSSVLEAIF